MKTNNASQPCEIQSHTKNAFQSFKKTKRTMESGPMFISVNAQKVRRQRGIVNTWYDCTYSIVGQY